jgi:SAM-dependent methyltransferase
MSADRDAGPTCTQEEEVSSGYGARMSDGHVRVNRDSWDADAPNWVERGRDAWALEEPIWGRGNLESEVHLLPDVSGLETIELGCGTAYISAWLMRRGARVIGLDNSSKQLATARTFQQEFDLHFPLVHADAERVPLMRASTSRSPSTEPRSGATRIGGFPRPPGSYVPVDASCSRRALRS